MNNGDDNWSNSYEIRILIIGGYNTMDNDIMNNVIMHNDIMEKDIMDNRPNG